MKISRRTSRADVPNMAMGDIAFNLLIFFVILARAQDDSHVKWSPAEAVERQSAGPSQVSVAIDTRGHLYLNGVEMGVARETSSGLADRIEHILSGRPQGERTVLLKIDRETAAEDFEPVIEAVSQAGGDLVHVVDEEQPN